MNATNLSFSPIQRGNSSMEVWNDASESLTSAELFVSLVFIVIIFILIKVINNYNHSKLEKVKKLKKLEDELENERKRELNEFYRLLKLKEYEEKDVAKVKGKVYLNVSNLKDNDEWIKTEKFDLTYVFKSNSSKEYEERLNESDLALRKYQYSVKPYLLNGILKKRNKNNQVYKKEFYKSGEIEYEIFYDSKGNLRNGIYQSFNKNGKLEYEWKYKDGKEIEFNNLKQE